MARIQFFVCLHVLPTTFLRPIICNVAASTLSSSYIVHSTIIQISVQRLLSGFKRYRKYKIRRKNSGERAIVRLQCAIRSVWNTKKIQKTKIYALIKHTRDKNSPIFTDIFWSVACAYVLCIDDGFFLFNSEIEKDRNAVFFRFSSSNFQCCSMDINTVCVFEYLSGN